MRFRERESEAQVYAYSRPPAITLSCQHDRPRTILAKFRGIAFGQCLHQFIVKIIEARGYRGRNPFIVNLATAINFVFKAVVEIEITATVVNFGGVVELDFRNEQTSESPRVVMSALFRFTSRCRNRSHGRDWLGRRRRRRRERRRRRRRRKRRGA